MRQTGAVEGRYLRLRKLMSQLFDHGGFGYDAIRVCLQQQNTEDLYSRWLFGLGEAPVSGSGEQRDAAEPGSGKSWKKAAERPVFSAAFLANRSLSRMYTGCYLKNFFKIFIKIHKNSRFSRKVAV